MYVIELVAGGAACIVAAEVSLSLHARFAKNAEVQLEDFWLSTGEIERLDMLAAAPEFRCSRSLVLNHLLRAALESVGPPSWPRGRRLGDRIECLEMRFVRVAIEIELRKRLLEVCRRNRINACDFFEFALSPLRAD